MAIQRCAPQRSAAPPEMRSRVLGVLTVCIGLGPIGFLHLGVLAELFGARVACIITGLEGLLVLVLTWRVWRPILAIGAAAKRDKGQAKQHCKGRGERAPRRRHVRQPILIRPASAQAEGLPGRITARSLGLVRGVRPPEGSWCRKRRVPAPNPPFRGHSVAFAGMGLTAGSGEAWWP